MMFIKDHNNQTVKCSVKCVLLYLTPLVLPDMSDINEEVSV